MGLDDAAVVGVGMSAEGCWDAWFDGLADGIRRGPVFQPVEPVRIEGGHGAISEPAASPSVAGAEWRGSGQLYDDERPE